MIPAGVALSKMLGKRPYFSLLPFKEARRMRMANPGSISQQAKAREVIVSKRIVIGRKLLGNYGQD